MALGARKKAVRGSRRTSASELLLLLPFLRILFIVFLFFLLPLFVLHLLYYRTSVCEPHGVQREHGAAMATNGNLVTGAADAHDGTGRAEEGGQHLFLAVSTAIRTHAGVQRRNSRSFEFEVVRGRKTKDWLRCNASPPAAGYDVTPDARSPAAAGEQPVDRPRHGHDPVAAIFLTCQFNCTTMLYASPPLSGEVGGEGADTTVTLLVLPTHYADLR